MRASAAAIPTAVLNDVQLPYLQVGQTSRTHERRASVGECQVIYTRRRSNHRRSILKATANFNCFCLYSSPQRSFSLHSGFLPSAVEEVVDFIIVYIFIFHSLEHSIPSFTIGDIPKAHYCIILYWRYYDWKKEP
jgi:hypothetical protein